MKQATTLFGWPRGWTVPLDTDRPLERDIELAKESAFTNVEIRPSWPTLDWKNRTVLKSCSERLGGAGLRVRSLHANFDDGDFAHVDSRIRVRSVSRHKRAIDVLHAFGGSLYVVDLRAEANEAGPVPGSWLWRTVRGLTRLSAKCKEKGVRLVVRLCLPEGKESEEVANWILDRLPAGEVALSIDLDSPAWRRFLLQREAWHRLQLGRIEVDEGSHTVSKWVRSYRRRLEEALGRNGRDGLLVVKPRPTGKKATVPQVSFPRSATGSRKAVSEL